MSVGWGSESKNEIYDRKEIYIGSRNLCNGDLEELKTQVSSSLFADRLCTIVYVTYTMSYDTICVTTSPMTG